MRAMRIHRYGPADVISEDEVPRPVPGPGEVLVRVAGSAFNPSEVGLRAGLLRAVLPVPLPYTLGWDLAGTVVDGPDAGRRVVARIDGGAAAEYVAAPAAALVDAPVAGPLAEAAAIPVAGLTAWQAVVTHGRVRAGQRVLVNGAGGGVGGFAVQLAKHAGAEVVATAGPRSATTLRRLGADRTVDYTATALTGSFDVVVHLVPAEAPIHLVAPGGTLVSATTPVAAPADGRFTATRFVAANAVGDLAALVALVDAGTVRLDVSAVRPLRELAAVHRDAEAGRIRGKVVLVP